VNPAGESKPKVHELTERAVKGDIDALSELLAAHGPDVQKGLQIGRRFRAALDPADVMQVSYLEAFMQIGTLQPEAGDSFAAWFRRIAANNLRDAIRGLERQKQLPPGRRIQAPAEADSFGGLYDLLAATSTTPSRLVARKDVRRLLEAAIAKLPADYAKTVRLYDLESKPIDEVCAALRRSPGAVHMLRARAHERLGTLLGTASAWFDSHT